MRRHRLVDADRGTGALAVGIRTFWIDRAALGGTVLCFGTGAGIAWGSDPEREWDETELKASRLLAVTLLVVAVLPHLRVLALFDSLLVAPGPALFEAFAEAVSPPRYRP